jgi:O-acetyl-ADP-ribose deacetylase (regulator of RNase III)
MGYLIKIKEGNIAKAKVDIVVNASNTKLILGSGVSMAIKRECGFELQEEMNKIVEKEIFYQGDVVITTAKASKNFSYILHTCIMDYNSFNRQKPSLKIIQAALYNIEEYLKLFWQKYNRNIKIAIPLLGCGIGGLNPKDVIKVYKEFFQREVPFEAEIIIYGYGKSNFEILKKTFN